MGALAVLALLLGSCVIDFDNLSGGWVAEPCPDGGNCYDAGDGSWDSPDTSEEPDAEAPDAPQETDAGDVSEAESIDAPADSQGDCPVLECNGCSSDSFVPEQFVKDPHSIALTADELLWTNQGDNTLMRLPASGGNPGLLRQATSALGAVAAGGGKVFWVEREGLWSCSLPGCADQALRVPAMVTGSMRQLAIYGTRIYWTDLGHETQDGKVRSCPLVGCSASATVDEAVEDVRPYGIAVNGSSLFWTDQGTETGDSGFIYTCSKGDCKETAVTNPVFRPTFIAIDADNHVFWTERPKGGVSRAYGCDYSVAQPCVRFDLAPDLTLTDANDIAVSDGRVYWTNPGPGTLTSCPLAGCNAPQDLEEHASGRTDIRRLAVNASCVFWTDGVGAIDGGTTVGRIGKAPK